MKNFEVKIYTSVNPKERWYVYVYDNSSQKIIHKTYKGINTEPDLFKRELICENFKKTLEFELENGWTPIKIKKTVKPLPQPYKDNLTIIEAYECAFNYLIASKREEKTKSDYKTHKNFFFKAIDNLNWTKNLFSELDQYHFNMIIEKMCELRNRSDAYFNKHLNLCKSFNTILVDKFIIKESKVRGLSEKYYVTPEKKLLTPEEQTKIIKHFEKVCPAYNVYLKTLYHLNIRPKELRLIKCGMIRVMQRKDKFFLFFELPEEITKNDKIGRILIPKDLQEDLLKYNCSNINHYLFGKDFFPSPRIQAVNRANKLWKKEVKDNLKINSDMYYLKSKSSNDKMRNGMSKEAVKVINRHSSEKITEIYATEHEIILMEKNIDKFGTFQ